MIPIATQSRVRDKVLLLYPLLLLGLRIINRWTPPRRGLRALAAIFAPYLFLPLLLLAPAARRREATGLRVLLIACAIAYGGRLLPRRRPPARAPTPGARQLKLMTWNILFDNPEVEAILRFLPAAPGEVVALQELTADHVERITQDRAVAARYPHQIVWPCGYGAGMALLSEYPILQHGRLDRPPTIWARLDLGGGTELVCVSAHPTFFPTRMTRDERAYDTSLLARARRIVDPRFLRFDPSHRDEGIAHVRALVEPMLRQGAPLILVGDFNVTEREPAYAELSAGLRDAFAVAGSGNGNTWRPEWLTGLPLPLLRIDYMLCSSQVRPLRLRVDRALRGSDHCPVHGIFELDAKP